MLELLGTIPRVGAVKVVGNVTGREYLITPQGTMVDAADVTGILETQVEYYCFRQQKMVKTKPIGIITPTASQWEELLRGE